MRVLVVDDNADFRALLVEDLRRKTSYDVVGEAEDGQTALRLVEETAPDLVLMDVEMPVMGGVDATRAIKERFPGVQILGVSALEDDSRRMLEAGACGFLLKGDGYRIMLDMELESRAQQDRLEVLVKNRSSELWNLMLKLEKAHGEVATAREEAIMRLAYVAELHDDETPQHVERVSAYTALLAEKLNLPGETIETMKWASMLHDIGKIGLPDHILMKTSSFTDDEFEAMTRHTEIGHRILKGGSSDLLRMAASIALSHHERFDGSGYPRQLAGNGIPFEARVVAVVDVFDALTTDRIWRKRFEFPEALEIMKRKVGTHFDPEIAEAFLNVLPTILTIKERFPENPLVAV
jgi:putative two-component system response regulator